MKLDKLANKITQVKSAPLIERRDDGRVQIVARIPKEKKELLKKLNISVQRFVDETLDQYIQGELERLKRYEA